MNHINNFDVAVIGGGLLGCFVARHLTRFKLSVAVIEKNPDVCAEISRANTSIIYSGYDNKPGTLKARMCTDANRGFDRLCDELSVPFKRCGSLMAATGQRGEAVLRRKLEQGIENGVPDLRLISGSEARAMEQGLSPDVTMALWSPSTGTVNPWELGIAAIENAMDNGAKLFLNTELAGVSPRAGGYALRAVSPDGQAEFTARAVVNCAGLFTDKISEMIAPPYFRISPTRGDYIVLDTYAQDAVGHIIFLEPEERGKGATLVPTVDGNVMLGPSEEDPGSEDSFATTASGLRFVVDSCREAVPALPFEHTIRSFGAVRPNIFLTEEDPSGNLRLSPESIYDFLIGSPEGQPLFINVPGVKTPGLTCADEIGKYVAEMTAERLGSVTINKEHNPRRFSEARFSRMSQEERLALKGSRNIVCRCREVTEDEIRNAIRRPAGARTVDGVKRRTGTCMGRCQGGFCTQRIIEILAEELGENVSDIRKEGMGSYLISGGNGKL